MAEICAQELHVQGKDLFDPAHPLEERRVFGDHFDDFQLGARA